MTNPSACVRPHEGIKLDKSLSAEGPRLWPQQVGGGVTWEGAGSSGLDSVSLTLCLVLEAINKTRTLQDKG